MDNRYYDNVIAELQPFFDENGFKNSGDGSFVNEKRSVIVEYSEERQMYLLRIAEVTDGIVGEYTEASSWLFDDSQNAKDAGSVGIDFTDTLRSNMGIKLKRTVNHDEIDLPTSEKSGVMTIAGFTKKVLDVFPLYKDQYKAHVAKYGNYLYIDFFAVTLVPQIKALLNEQNKKQNKKLFELLDDAYIHGDRETVNAAVAVLAAAVYQDDSLKAAATEMLEEDKHFLSSFNGFVPAFEKNKKLVSAFIK